MNITAQFYGLPPQEPERYEKKVYKSREIGSDITTTSNQCKVCGLVNFNSWALTMHMRRHNNERPSKCSDCSASFVNNSELKSHMATKHTKEKRHKCRFCSESFSSNSSRYFHEDKHGILQHKCKFCEENFKTKIQRRIHQKTHAKEELTCNYCPKKFANEDFLKTHEENDHGKVIKSLKCFKCKLKFNTKIELNAHKEIHKLMAPTTRRTQINPKSNEVSYFQDSDVKLSTYFFTCGVCSEKFSFHIDLAKHIESNHSAEKDDIYKFKCDICNKSFDSQVKLRGHKIGHGPKKHKCHNCDYRTARAKDLERHVEARHSNHKAYKCSECGEAFTQFYNFVNHKLKHGEKKFKCSDCDKAYYVKSRLSKHVRSVHNSERQVCDQCGRVYSNMLSLKVHKNYMHKSPPLCLCNYCGKSILVNEIQEHQAQCTKISDSPASKQLKGPLCSECNITFSVPRYLLEHSKEFHPHNVYPCRACQNEYLSSESAEKHFSRVHAGKQKIVAKQASVPVFTIEEKRSLRTECSASVLNDFYECFACGIAFSHEYKLDMHLSLDLCISPLPTFENLSSFNIVNYFNITKIHNNGSSNEAADNFEIKILPKSTFSKPLGLNVKTVSQKWKSDCIKPEIKMELSDLEVNLPFFENNSILQRSTLDKSKSKNSEMLNRHENVFLRQKKSPVITKELLAKPRNVPVKIRPRDVPILTARIVPKNLLGLTVPFNVQTAEVAAVGISNIEDNLKDSKIMPSLGLVNRCGVISSKNLMDMLQEKIVNLHGQSFLPLNEVMDHLKQLTGISVNNSLS